MNSVLINFTNSNVPVLITGNPTLFRFSEFFGYSGFNAVGLPISNANSVYISPANNSGQFPLIVPKSGNLSIDYSTKDNRDNLAAYWAMGTANDGLYIIYQ